MKEVKLGPATVTSFRNTTVAIAVATMLSASMAASGADGARISSALAGTAPIRHHRAAGEHDSSGRDQRVGGRPVAREDGVDGIADGTKHRQLIEQFRTLPSQFRSASGPIRVTRPLKPTTKPAAFIGFSRSPRTKK